MNVIPSGVFHWNKLALHKYELSVVRKITKGTTNEFNYFEVAAVTQEKGAKLSSAQKTDVEQLIIIKDGKMKATIGDTTALLGAGSVLLISPGETQMLENAGDGGLTYYVFQFKSKEGVNLQRNKDAGGTLILNSDSLPFVKTEKGATKKYFNRPTAACENYEMHITQLACKGASHAPHQHVDTEIILVIDGDVEMVINGKNYTGAAGDMFFVASGEMHEVINASEKPCSYFAFKWR